MLEWFKRSWLYIAIVSALGVAAMLYRKRLLSTQAKSAIDIELAKIETAKKHREEMAREAGVERERIEAIDAEIEASKREVVSLHRSIDGMDSSAISAAFDRLGY